MSERVFLAKIQGYKMQEPSRSMSQPFICVDNDSVRVSKGNQGKTWETTKATSNSKVADLGRNFFGRAQIQHVGCLSLLLALAEALRLETMETLTSSSIFRTNLTNGQH